MSKPIESLRQTCQIVYGKHDQQTRTASWQQVQEVMAQVVTGHHQERQTSGNPENDHASQRSGNGRDSRSDGNGHDNPFAYPTSDSPAAHWMSQQLAEQEFAPEHSGDRQQSFEMAIWMAVEALHTVTPTPQQIWHEATPTLEQMGVVEHDPAEGRIGYTTIDQTVIQWWQEHNNPEQRGRDVLTVLEKYLGIDEQTARNCPELQEYWRYIDEGRFMAMVAMQVNQPTPYFLTNLLELAQLYEQSRRKLPVAMMVMEFPNDYFYLGNGDKVGGMLGHLEIPTLNRETGQIEVQQLPVAPYALLQPVDAKVRKGQTLLVDEYDEPMILDLADGQYQVATVMDPTHKSETISKRTAEEYAKQFRGSRCSDVLVSVPMETLQELRAEEMALLHPDEETAVVRYTDLYKFLWDFSITMLRAEGYLPPQEEMPIFSVDVTQMYGYMTQHAQPDPEFLQAHGWDEMPVRRDGLMRGDVYYIVQTIWAHLYIECSSCMAVSNDRWMEALTTHEELREAVAAKIREVRLPDVELEQCGLETLTILDPQAFPEEYRAYLKTMWQQVANSPDVQDIFRQLQGNSEPVTRSVGSFDQQQQTTVYDAATSDQQQRDTMTENPEGDDFPGYVYH